MATWNVNLSQTPKSSDSPTEGDDAIRNLASAIEERMKNEHKTYSGDSTAGLATIDWVHKAGSAVAFYTGTAPTVRIVGGSAIDLGQLWYDSTSGVLKVCTNVTGPVWTDISEIARMVMIQGILVGSATDILPAIIFPKGCKILKVSARVKTAPTGASITIDFNKNGSSSIYSGTSLLTITAGSYSATTTTFHTANSTLAADDYLTMDIDTVGSTIAGSDLTIVIQAA